MPKPKIKRLYLIPILSKALDILELLVATKASISLEDVYKQTNISKTSVYRILKTFVHRGYVAQAQNGDYRLVSRPSRLRFGFGTESAEMPFSVAVAASVAAAAASAGIELVQLDNQYDSDTAIRNAEEFVRQRVDLVLEFQVEENAAPLIAHILKKAEIPLVAIDVPHPNATYFGVDNFDVGYDAGALLALHARSQWKGNIDWILGIGISQAGSFVQSRITGAFAAIRERLELVPADRFVRLEGRGLREASSHAVSKFLQETRKGQRILVAASTDLIALGVLDAAREAGREKDFAIVGQDCIPEVLEEMRRPDSAIIGSVSHQVEDYGPRLIQLGIAMLRGNAVPPYNYVHHRLVTRDELVPTPTA